MSQYPYPPPPYVPPTGGWVSWEPPLNLLGPARIASSLQFLLWGLLALNFIPSLLLVLTGHSAEVLAALSQQQAAYPQFGSLSTQTVLHFYEIIMAILSALSLAMLLLALLVRRGGWIPAILSLIANGCLGLFLVLILVVRTVLLGPNPEVLVLLAVVALCGVTIAKLVAALRTAAQIHAMRLMQRAQFGMLGRSAGEYAASGGFPLGAAWDVPQPPSSALPPLPR